MASIFIVNSYQINFESVLMIPDHDGMLNMFKALEASGLRGFLGCESVLYEKELHQFFETTLVQGEDITGTVSGKFFSISQAQFARVFELPTEGVVNFSEVPKDRVYDARSFFSKKGEQVEIHGKKKPMKYEFRLLNDILAKVVPVKAGSFDAVTVELFQLMTAIHYGLKVNWGKVLFNVLKDMVDKSQRKAKGFAAQIGVLLKSIPAISLGEGVPFPFAKILSMKTVNTYIATNTTIDAREEQGMVVAGSKNRVATEDIAPAIPTKRRTVKTKHSSSQASLDIMPVVQDVVPIQVIDPTPAAAAIKSPALKRKSRKRRLVLTTGYDDETMGQQELVKDTDKAAAKTSDEVAIIIEQVLEETLLLGVSEEEHGEQGVDEAAFADDFAQWLDDFVARNTEPEIVETRNVTSAADSTSPVTVQEMNKAVNSRLVTEENMSIDDLLLQISDDMLLPSISSPDISKIRLGESVSINEVRERDVYLTSLPRISTHDKGKSILEEDEPIRGNPAHELVEIICGDIEFFIRIRDQVMVDVVEFFHSFSLNTFSNFDALLALKAKEKLMLEWAETDSLAMAVKRKGYILAKYRELLLRKFLDSHQKFLAPGQPWTATTSQIIDLLSDAHSISLEDLLAQQRAHGLPMEQPCASTASDSSVDSGAVLAKFYSVAKSTCWVRPMILIDGIWTPLQGPNFWKSCCHLSLFLNQKKMPKPAIEDIFALHVSLVEPVQYWEASPYLIKTWRWAQVCTDIVRYSMFGCLKPVRELPCTDITVYNLGIERIPADFLIMFAQGMACHSFFDSVVQRDSGYLKEVDLTDVEEVDLVSSDVSTVYRSPSPIVQEVDSTEHDLQFALGPAIFPSVAQEERLYFVQSPASSSATSQPQDSSSPSTDVSMHFDSTDVPLNAQADTQASAPVDFTMFTDALEDLRSSISQRIMILTAKSYPRVQERQGVTQEMHINDLKKGMLAPVATIFQDLMAIKKGQREQDAKITALDSQIAAIRSEQLDFQSKLAADILSLSTQIGDIADYIRGDDAKKGEIGSSSRRPPPIRVERHPLPTPANQGESSSGHGRVPSVEEAAEMIREADRQADRLEREREREKRLRRLRRRGH
ncbi:dystroglycan-like [Dorcoceras hygrometricum]|uniref:Dystroglycan-like n=1 Tax=Dorcoceras hygrometricum TaxID=472368 RepID=A0A2Z7AI99_9LAMI|nr:dystroglycan-like [Dorcoceras hygrometricum]